MKHVQLTTSLDEKNTLSQVQASDSTKNHIHGEIQKKHTIEQIWTMKIHVFNLDKQYVCNQFERENTDCFIHICIYNDQSAILTERWDD